MPDDGPRHFELENTFGKFRLRAKQPAQLAVPAPAAGSRRPARRRPLGSMSRGSLLWTAHELAAQQHGRSRWSTSPPGEYRPVPSFNHSNCKKDHGHSRMTMVIRCRPPLASHWQRVAGGFARPAAVYGWGLVPFKLHEQPHRPAIAGGSSSMPPGLKVGDEATARAGKVNDDEWMKGALKGKGWGRTEIEGRVRSFVCGTGGKHGK